MIKPNTMTPRKIKRIENACERLKISLERNLSKVDIFKCLLTLLKLIEDETLPINLSKNVKRIIANTRLILTQIIETKLT